MRSRLLLFDATLCDTFGREEEKRFAYTTPKSFLELIKLYSGMLGKQARCHPPLWGVSCGVKALRFAEERKVFALADKKSRLSSGLIKLRATQEEAPCRSRNAKNIQRLSPWSRKQESDVRGHKKILTGLPLSQCRPWHIQVANLEEDLQEKAVRTLQHRA